MKEIDPRIPLFLAALGELNPGERARLRRNAGNTLAEAQDNALTLFYRLRPYQLPEYQEDTYFLLATLYPLAQSGGSGNLGHALRHARGPENAPGLDRRVAILLDADSTQLRFRLSQAVRYLASRDTPVNWPRLLEDLLQWTHPARFIQRQWARAYFTSEVEAVPAQS